MDYITPTAAGVALGTLARYIMLRSDYRQYPTYPHGAVTHLSLGFIGAALGAVAIPALLEKDFAAISFLSLAATQFRDVREMERSMLSSIEHSELVPRGPDYIEGIARVFEARNYLVIIIALLVSGFTAYTNIGVGILVSIIALFFANKLMKGKVVGQIAKVREGEVRFEGPQLFVDDIHFMNLGTEETRQTVLSRGLGVIIEPLDDNARATLANSGQRQAIAHEASAQVGVYRDVDTAEFMPISRRDLDTGRIGLIILPIEKDIECLIEAVKRTPVLESAMAKPLKSKTGRGASD
ncbi:MAG: YIEGIA family protein [Dethiobacteria bacterium]|jgi:hypothetical protein|nr:hypothetical protein [Bacillota bacterium]